MLSDFLDVYGPTYFMSLHDSRQRIACHFGESRVLNRDVHAGLGWHHLGSDWYDAQGGWLVGDDLKLDQAERFGHRRNEFELCIGHQGDKALNGMSMIQLCHPLCFEEVSGELPVFVSGGSLGGGLSVCLCLQRPTFFRGRSGSGIWQSSVTRSPPKCIKMQWVRCSKPSALCLTSCWRIRFIILCEWRG